MKLLSKITLLLLLDFAPNRTFAVKNPDIIQKALQLLKIETLIMYMRAQMNFQMQDSTSKEMTNDKNIVSVKTKMRQTKTRQRMTRIDASSV